jgi:hypothetical protein
MDLLDADVVIDSLSGTWVGNELTLTAPVVSMQEAANTMPSANRILPAVLSFRFKVFVWIKAATSTINESAFRVETIARRYGINITTAERNQPALIGAVGWDIG